jgi:hypothetical protein
MILSPRTAFVVRSAMASEPELDDFQIRFQEAHGARLFRQGKPRAVLEVKSPDISMAIYEARLRGYDRRRPNSPLQRCEVRTLCQRHRVARL